MQDSASATPADIHASPRISLSVEGGGKKRVTIPYERTRAVLQTRELLKQLCDAKETPRIPKRIRERAGSLLEHYPTPLEVEIAHRAAPDHFGPVPPFSRVGVTRFVKDVLDVAGEQSSGD